jgi:DNA-binding NarL/FixJ family response regulator
MTRSVFRRRLSGVESIRTSLPRKGPPVRRMPVQSTTPATGSWSVPPGAEPRSDPVRAIIVDQEQLLAEALELVLLAEGIMVDAITSPGGDILDDVRRGWPDVVIVGVDAPTAAEVRRGESIVEACRTARVLLIASNVDRAGMLQVSRAGLHCIPKNASVADLVRTVRILASGRVPPRHGFAPTAVDGAHHGPMGPVRPALTPRELEVLKLVAAGATGRSIARQLGISENTVRTHSQSILGKLQVHSRLEAAAYAIRSGLVRLGSQGTDGLAS